MDACILLSAACLAVSFNLSWYSCKDAAFLNGANCLKVPDGVKTLDLTRVPSVTELEGGRDLKDVRISFYIEEWCNGPWANYVSYYLKNGEEGVCHLDDTSTNGRVSQKEISSPPTSRTNTSMSGRVNQTEITSQPYTVEEAEETSSTSLSHRARESSTHTLEEVEETTSTSLSHRARKSSSHRSNTGEASISTAMTNSIEILALALEFVILVPIIILVILFRKAYRKLLRELRQYVTSSTASTVIIPRALSLPSLSTTTSPNRRLISFSPTQTPERGPAPLQTVVSLEPHSQGSAPTETFDISTTFPQVAEASDVSMTTSSQAAVSFHPLATSSEERCEKQRTTFSESIELSTLVPTDVPHDEKSASDESKFASTGLKKQIQRKLFTP